LDSSFRSSSLDSRPSSSILCRQTG
jgi:hypothetical protein